MSFRKEVIAFNKEWINNDFNPNETLVDFFFKMMVLYLQLGITRMIAIIHAMKKEVATTKVFLVFQEWKHIISSLQNQICKHIG